MITLGIETSCDETSAAILENDTILANIISTQMVHEKFGGVVPEYASRAHIRTLNTIVKSAFIEANRAITDIDGCAVTYGPGLAGSLLVGLSFCKGLCARLKIPFIGINHIEGHIMAAGGNPRLPFICLVVSGGHTQLVHVPEPLQFHVIGRSIDDAAGEAFDKVAKILDLGYPGGPVIEKTANDGDPKAVSFPRALMEKDNLNFSFSGIKTAVLYHAQRLSSTQLHDQKQNIAASFQQAVVDVLVKKSQRALEKYNCNHLVLAGGVARNTLLRQTMRQMCEQQNSVFTVPAPELCTDNAAMIARVGNLRLQRGERSDLALDVYPNLSLDI